MSGYYPSSSIERLGGSCMIDAVREAERHFLGHPLTEDIEGFYSDVLAIDNDRNKDATQVFNERLAYLLASLGKSAIRLKQEVPKEDSSSPPIPRIATSEDVAKKGMLALTPPLLVATFRDGTEWNGYDIYGTMGHVWFVADSRTLTNGIDEHMGKRTYPNNFYAGELELAK